MLGHKFGGYGPTEIYAKYDPDHLGQATSAIDAYWAELQARTTIPLILNKDELRLSSVRVPNTSSPQRIEIMVGAVGFEPTTPTMSP